METYKPFSIVVVPFPFTDISRTKKRPALVLSSEHFQKVHQHVTLLMITSAKHSTWESDYCIKQLEMTKLPAASIIRQKIFTIDTHLVLHALGRLSDIDKKAVTRTIKAHLSFQ